MYSRNANLKQVILDELFAKHGDAELNAQFHQTASMGALQREIQSVTVELTGYKFSNALVIRTEVTRTICQVIFQMMTPRIE